jgi:hypothetical protein
MLRFEYRLTGRGWSVATISCGDATVELTTSYLSDALGDLARAAIALNNGAHHVTVSWAEEPGEYRWLLTRTDDLVSIRILSFRSQHPRRPDADGEPVFRASCRLTDFAGQVTSQLRALAERLGDAGYKEQWVLHDFPRAEYETLVGQRRERRRRQLPGETAAS